MSTLGGVGGKYDLSVNSSEDKDISEQQVIKMMKFIKGLTDKRTYARSHQGDKGESWSLPFKAIEAAGAVKPCQTCKHEDLYVWGRRIDEIDLKTGDIIQIEGKAQFTTTDNRVHTFPHEHHSMVVIEYSPLGSEVRVAQQWAGQRTMYTTYRLKSKTGDGVVYYYRPQKP
jgi:hypothetical protein